MKILVADDDPTFRQLLGGLLTRWGHEPVIVTNGYEAWEHLQYPDGSRLALLDWEMPGMTGLQVCRRIRSEPSQGYTYVVMITARSGMQDATTALDAGCDDIITKPFDAAELLARINTAQRILGLEENLLRRAFYDELTGLPNRALLAEQFRRRANAAARDAGMLAIFYIDLDRFKTVNDNLGHAAGDALLKEIASRLTGSLAETQILARVGGDEFVCLAPVDNTDAAVAFATRVRIAIELPVCVAGNEISTSASIGISLFPGDGDNLDVLLQNADSAMYESKRRRASDSCQLFSVAIGSRHRSRVALETRLPGALRRHEFAVHYQPIFRLSDLSLTGSEALIRWNDPTRGLVSPEDFIPIAEETGQIVEIGRWILRQACAQAKQWASSASSGFRVAVNISASHFSDNSLAEDVSEALARTGLDAGMLELEMTETAFASDLAKSAATINSLARLGVRVSLDDFGTGYSSLSYLANLPINTLKIDRSFLIGLDRQQRCTSVLEAIVNLAHKLGILVVAEGIEDSRQLRAARAAGCDEGQGMLLANPGLPNGVFKRMQQRIPVDLFALASVLEPTDCGLKVSGVISSPG